MGSGHFVNMTLEQSEKILEKKYLSKRPIDELIEIVSKKFEMTPEMIWSKSKMPAISKARAIVAWMAVEEVGYSKAEVARYLGMSRMGVQKALIKANKK